MAAEQRDNIEQLWRKYSETRDMAMRDQILQYYIPLVKSIVYRLRPKYSGYCDSDDLVSCGVVGLIDAVEKFDVNYGVKFETYATTRVRGEILDYMRRQDWAPSSLRKKINSINSAYDNLEWSLGRHPTDGEVARELDMSEDQVQEVMAKTQMFNMVYFEDMVDETNPYSGLTACDDDSPAEIAEKKEVRELLAKLIESLPEKERLIITLYYYEELTLKQIAGVLDISESRVSQIHSKLLSRMGYKLGKMFE